MDIIGQNRIAGQKLIESTQDDSFNYDEYLQDFRKIRDELLKKNNTNLKRVPLISLTIVKNMILEWPLPHQHIERSK